MTELAHGYTLDDLNQMARAAVVADRLMAMPIDERFDIAWSAIAFELCAAEETPDRQALVRVGWQAIYRHVRDGRRQRGVNDDHDTMPRFVMFWGTGVTSSPEDAIVEKLGIRQAIEVLRGPNREAVLAFAIHGDYQRAADALGIQYRALVARLGVARSRVDAAWFGDETPRKRQIDRRVESYAKPPAAECSKGHAYTPENTRIRHRMLRGKPNTSRVCRTCESGKKRAA